jgi:hypothetical protein
MIDQALKLFWRVRATTITLTPCSDSDGRLN